MQANLKFQKLLNQAKLLELNEKKIIHEIEEHVYYFRKWLNENYSKEDIKNHLYDDTGYPDWTKIEDTFEIAFENLDFNLLANNELKLIEFLIARQWNVGVIFPFFKKEISQLGMTENQLLVLAKHGVKSDDWSFRQQCAASLGKVKNNQRKAIEIALEYLKDKDQDIRRHASNSLTKLSYHSNE